MSFWKLYYHLIWAVRDRAPLLTPPVEALVIDTIQRKSRDLESAIHAINSVPDHLHIAVSIPPKIAVSDWVRQIKGRSAREVNTFYPDLEPAFAWQTSYGALSFGIRQLPTVVAYITNQKTHHAESSLISYLERDTE